MTYSNPPRSLSKNIIRTNLYKLLLEINARPGLSIQIANQSGLIPQLKTVESYLCK